MAWLSSPAYNLDLTRTYQAPVLTQESAQSRQQVHREVTDGNGMLLPHYRSFVGLFNTMTRLYSYRWDEAMRYGEENAKAMQRDAYLRSLQQERILPLARWKWEVKVDSDEDDMAESESGIVGADNPQGMGFNPSNPKDPYSNDREDIRRKIESICRRTFELHQMRIYLGQAIWYGRYGAQVRWDKINIAGEPRWAVGYAEPVQGDKIFHDWDGTPGVMINAMGVNQYPPELIKTTDRGGPILLLKRPEFRRRFIVHKHLVEDADYFDYMQAGRVHGVGLRDFCYWAWWLRDEMLSWLVDFMEKVGNLGLWLFPYEEGNPDSRAEAENAAKNVQGRSALAIPVPKGRRDVDLFKPEVVNANVAGANFLKEIVGDYFERHIERLFVGQSMSSGSDGEGSLGGTGRAEFAADTKFNLLSFDAENLASTLTNDLLVPIQRMNFPESKWRYTWNFSLPDPKADKKLDAGTKLVSAGVAVKADELREAGGYTKPDEGDEIVGGQQPGAGGVGPDGMPIPGAGGPVPGMDGQVPGADNPQEIGQEEEPGSPVPPELVQAMLKAAAEDDMETVDRLAELAKDPDGLAGLMDDLEHGDSSQDDATRTYADLWWEVQPRDENGRWLKLAKDKKKKNRPQAEPKEESGELQTAPKPVTDRSYSWVGIELTGDARKKMLSLAYAIPSEDLAKDGRETDPHVTARYGIHTNSPDEVADVVEEFGKFAINFGELGVFEHDEYDVLHVKVSSPRLKRLNRELGDLEHTDTHGEYKPHATIAYVKKGMGKEYVRLLAEEEKTPIPSFTVEKIVFGTTDDELYEIPLTKKEPEPERVYSYEWIADRTKRTNRLKAVWSMGGRKPLYGEQARRALERQGKGAEPESADKPQKAAQVQPQKKLQGAAVAAKKLGQSREEGREKARQAYQKAIADPSSLTTADIDGLRTALHELKRDEIREAVKSLNEKTWGKVKAELVDKLIDHVRGKMPTTPNKPMPESRRPDAKAGQQPPPEPEDEDEELSRDEIAEFDKRIQEAKSGKRAELEAKAGPLPIQASEEELSNDDYEPETPQGRTAKIGGVEFSEDELAALRQRRERLAASRSKQPETPKVVTPATPAAPAAPTPADNPQAAPEKPPEQKPVGADNPQKPSQERKSELPPPPQGGKEIARTDNGAVMYEDAKGNRVTPLHDEPRRKEMAGKLAKSIDASLKYRKMFKGWGDGLIPVDVIIHDVMKKHPEATVNDVQNAIWQLNKDWGVELHVLNEVHTLPQEPQQLAGKAIWQNDGRAYHYVVGNASDHKDNPNGVKFDKDDAKVYLPPDGLATDPMGYIQNNQTRQQQQSPQTPESSSPTSVEDVESTIASLDDMGKSELIELAQSIGVKGIDSSKGSASIRSIVSQELRKKKPKKEKPEQQQKPLTGQESASAKDYTEKYKAIRDQKDKLDIAGVRSAMKGMHSLPKSALKKMAEELGFSFNGTAKEIADYLQENLERLTMSRINGESILEGK